MKHTWIYHEDAIKYDIVWLQENIKANGCSNKHNEPTGIWYEYHIVNYANLNVFKGTYHESAMKLPWISNFMEEKEHIKNKWLQQQARWKPNKIRHEYTCLHLKDKTKSKWWQEQHSWICHETGMNLWWGL